MYDSHIMTKCVLKVDGNSTTLSMSVHFKQLKRLVEEPTFSQILIPLQSVLIPTLPSTGGANTQHDAFPGHWAYLDGFEDTVRERELGCRYIVINIFGRKVPDDKKHLTDQVYKEIFQAKQGVVIQIHDLRKCDFMISKIIFTWYVPRKLSLYTVCVGGDLGLVAEA